MAASFYPSPFEEAAGEEVKEGFLCPLCLKDLQSFYQLQEHYEEEHSGEERHHIGGQLKSLVQKAKKATDKLWKKDGDERGDAGAYESFYYGGVDPYMWEPQELGATRSHLDSFKKQRAARIDHYVVEVNKLIIRLEKLTSLDRTNSDPAKIRAAEKSLVSWVKDSDVPFCPDCGSKFNLRNRRHHCRLCGSIMCRKCMDFVALPLAQKLIGGTREAPSAPGGGGAAAANAAAGPRRGSLSSLSSVTSASDDKDDDKIRCCGHCAETLLKRERKMDEQDFVPDVVKLYQRLRMCMEKVDEKAPQYIRMAESLNAGETTYNLETAGGLRLEVQKYYELIDALSKKILTLGTKDEPQPRPKVLQLQRMVRYSATLFVQEKLLGLTSLPTKQKYEELKEKRKEEQERRLQQERLAAQEAPKRRQESEKKRPPADGNGETTAQAPHPRLTKVGGWLPSSRPGLAHDGPEDPLLQQMDNIRSFLRQAREARRADEVTVLEENLRQLRDEYERQQVAQEDERRRPEEREESRHAAPCDLVLAAGDLEPMEESAVAERDHESPPLSRDTCDDTFRREGSTPIEEDASNPFCEDIRRERGEVANGKKEYNPFDEDENQEDDAPAERVPGNPFEDDDDAAESAAPFAADSNAGSSSNPFECADAADNVDSIEEELLLQQIDNIRAYIFDAKLSGRPDEVELLAENLRELQRALREQKTKRQ
ncbi:rabenosyn-5 [Hippocampus zosterae]|uniref:rabenosyn-5 n=1 Tax=Hippocampus zosterae TaxID=109293 RepID=UPI00223DBD27|nr:rabenosyn-5 [Hippocampus zosterae]XP_051910625.1 rabenosyn-5 [Hippocampus zosterae]